MCHHKGQGQHLTTHFLSLSLSLWTVPDDLLIAWVFTSGHTLAAFDRTYVESGFCQIGTAPRHRVWMLQCFLAQWFLLPVWVRMATFCGHRKHRLWCKHYRWSLAAPHSWRRLKLCDVKKKKKQKILEGRNTRSYSKNDLLEITASRVCGWNANILEKAHWNFLPQKDTNHSQALRWFTGFSVLCKFNLYLLNIQSTTRAQPPRSSHICLLFCFPASSLCLGRVLCRLWTWLTSGQWPVCRPPADAVFSRCVFGSRVVPLGCVSADSAPFFKYTPVFYRHMFWSWIVLDRRASSPPGSYSCRWPWGSATLRIHQGSGSRGSKSEGMFRCLGSGRRMCSPPLRSQTTCLSCLSLVFGSLATYFYFDEKRKPLRSYVLYFIIFVTK